VLPNRVAGALLIDTLANHLVIVFDRAHLNLVGCVKHLSVSFVAPLIVDSLELEEIGLIFADKPCNHGQLSKVVTHIELAALVGCTNGHRFLAACPSSGFWSPQVSLFVVESLEQVSVEVSEWNVEVDESLSAGVPVRFLDQLHQGAFLACLNHELVNQAVLVLDCSVLHYAGKPQDLVSVHCHKRVTVWSVVTECLYIVRLVPFNAVRKRFELFGVLLGELLDLGQTGEVFDAGGASLPNFVLCCVVGVH